VPRSPIVPSTVLEQARRLAVGTAAKPEHPIKKKVVAALKKLHPMD